METQTRGLEGLQAREIIVREAVGKLEAQRPILVRQLENPNPGMKLAAEGQLMQLDLDLVSAKVELESVQQQIRQQGGQTQGPAANVGVHPVPPRAFLDRIDDDVLTAMSFITLMAFLLPLSIGLSRRLWRRPAKSVPALSQDAAITRLDRLEQAVDSIAIEIERVAEGQRFVTKALTERPVQVKPASAHVANDAAGLGEAQPFLALGAGPIEPVRAAERQAVRQSITPH